MTQCRNFSSLQFDKENLSRKLRNWWAHSGLVVACDGFSFQSFSSSSESWSLFFSETKNKIGSVSPSRHCDILITYSCLAPTTTLSLRIKRVNLYKGSPEQHGLVSPMSRRNVSLFRIEHLVSFSLLWFCFQDFPHNPQPKYRDEQTFSRSYF